MKWRKMQLVISSLKPLFICFTITSVIGHQFQERKRKKERGGGGGGKWDDQSVALYLSFIFFYIIIYFIFFFFEFVLCDYFMERWMERTSRTNYTAAFQTFIAHLRAICVDTSKKKWIKEGKERQPWSDTTTELKTKHEKVTHKKSEKMTIKSIVWNLINEPAIVRHTRSKRKRTRQPPWNGQRHKLAPSIKENETGTLLKKRHATISSPYSVDYGI